MAEANYNAFYLKYRPQSLDDLIGQDHIKKNLAGAFTQKKLFHAYLFVGPRGTGKTSTARILAKMVNCEGNEKREASSEIPCNKCSVCLSITDGSNLDLIEIDAASNRGIEDIRSLREKIKLSPTSLTKKVYIIDEVHMLTTEAFNALLKILEEPPKHAFFILATTNVEKLPQTILSRVQRLDFKLAQPDELLQILQKIVKAEQIDIDEDCLKLLVKKSEGSFRDGVKLLDQVSSLDKKITVDILEKNLKSSNFEQILKLLSYISKKDTKAALAWVNQQSKDGMNTQELILSFMDSLRSLIFIINGLGKNLVEPNILEENYQKLIKVSKGFINKELVKNLDILQKALEKLKTSSIPTLPLEVAVVEICGLDDQKKSESSDKIRLNQQSDLLFHRSSDTQPSSDLSDSQSISDSSDILKIKEKWIFVLETIRPFNFSLEALLRSINIAECNDTTIILEVPYSFHQRILEAPKNRDLLEGVLSDILGRSIQISVRLGKRTVKAEDIANIEVAQDDDIIRAAAEIFNSDSIN